MKKTLTIALRDYLAAVRTKSFVISLLLMPVLVGGSMLIGNLSQNFVDTDPKRIAVIDRSAIALAEAATRPDQSPSMMQRLLGAGGYAAATDRRPLYQALTEAAQERDEEIRNEKGRATRAPYLIEPVLPAEDGTFDLEAQRLALSERVRDGELFAFIEIGPSIVSTSPEDMAELAEAAKRATEVAEELDLETDDLGTLLTMKLPPELQVVQDLYGVRYTSKSTTNPEVLAWIQAQLSPAVLERKLSGLNVPPDRAAQLRQPLAVNQRPLAERGPDGGIRYEADPNPVVGLFLPIVSVMLLFALMGTAAFPLTTNIIEEKQMRIAEVLLASVRPFELMLGKLLGGVALSLTLATIYGAGGFVAALQFDFLREIGWDVLLWFAVFAALATLMIGSLSVAAGAAVTNVKEAQNIQTPIILLPTLPLIVSFNIAQNPHGPIAHLFTWFPLTTPITSVMRIGVRDGMSTPERFLAALLCLATTTVLIWIAGRVFRHGMLRSEKAAGWREMARWVTRG